MKAAVDQIIDSLAFGKGKPQTGPCLGLYLSPEMVYIAATRLGKGECVTVDHLVRIPIPLDGKATGGTLTMSTNFLADPLKVGGLIRQSMSQSRWHTKNVVVTLSHHLGLLRYFPMPLLAERFLAGAVPIEAKKYIPIPFDTLTYDFQAGTMPSDATGKPRMGALIAVTQNQNLANISALITSLGLNLIGLEVAPCSVLRLWQGVEPVKGPQSFIQVHFDDGNIRIMVCDNGFPVFFRELFMGAVTSLADQRKVDMTGCLSFARKQLGLSGISKIKLSGTPATLGPWKEAFTAETGMPVEIQDTAKLLSIKGGDWGGYAAIGASARSSLHCAVTIDLATINRISVDERHAARDIIAAAMALAVFLAGVGLFKMTTYSYRARELSRYVLAPEARAAVQEMSAADINLKLIDMREQLARLRGVTGGKRLMLSTLLREFVEIMPVNVWLTNISVNNPLSTDHGELVLTLEGRVVAATGAEEQDVVSKFQETLRRDPHFGPLFDMQLTLQAKAPEQDRSASALAPEALASEIEGRTQFILEMKGHR
ncbi:MAG: hypothetical protein AAB268_11405 [Elusimicrobiota bacterium]